MSTWLYICNDAWLDAYDCAILISNDSDIAESLKLVKQHHSKNIGLLSPVDIPVRWEASSASYG
jgi:hypothetical protein